MVKFSCACISLDIMAKALDMFRFLNSKSFEKIIMGDKDKRLALVRLHTFSCTHLRRLAGGAISLTPPARSVAVVVLILFMMEVITEDEAGEGGGLVFVFFSGGAADGLPKLKFK